MEKKKQNKEQINLGRGQGAGRKIQSGVNPEYTRKKYIRHMREAGETLFFLREGKRRMSHSTVGIHVFLFLVVFPFFSFFATLFTHMSTYIISLHKPNIGDYVIDILYYIILYYFYVYIYMSHLFLLL